MCDLVQRQSMLLGHLLHLVHSRPAFPLSQTADAFWDKLAGVLQSSQHVQAAERQLLRLLAGMTCRPVSAHCCETRDDLAAVCTPVVQRAFPVCLIL